MQTSDIQNDVTDRRALPLNKWLPFPREIALLALGGILTVAWTCALASCAYEALCWFLI